MLVLRHGRRESRCGSGTSDKTLATRPINLVCARTTVKEADNTQAHSSRRHRRLRRVVLVLSGELVAFFFLFTSEVRETNDSAGRKRRFRFGSGVAAALFSGESSSLGRAA